MHTPARQAVLAAVVLLAFCGGPVLPTGPEAVLAAGPLLRARSVPAQS